MSITNLNFILGAKVTSTMGDVIYFNVDDDGRRLWHVFYALDMGMSANVSVIQVVARSGQNGF